MNLAGMVAANVLCGDIRLAKWGELPNCGALLVDVREEEEFRRDSIDGDVNIPLHRLRQRLRELPKDRPIRVNFARGQRPYYAVRILQQYGLDAYSLFGGYSSWEA
jgi:rhodanese-related sulfurtransferase